MGLVDTLGRIPKILESNINTLLDKCEDPVKMMNQLLIDAKKDLADVKVSLAEAKVAMDKAQKAYDDNEAAIQRKEQAAKNAIKAGAPYDAKQLITDKQHLEASRGSLMQTRDITAKNYSTLQQGYNKLVDNINELERRKSVTEGKAAAAKGQEVLNATSKKADSRKALDAFDRYEEKVDQRLQVAQAMSDIDAEVGAEQDLEDKYAGAGNTVSVEEELARLTAEVNSEGAQV